MFLFHLKSSLRSQDIQIFVFLTLFFSLSAIALEVDPRKILNLDVINCLNKNLITHFFDIFEKKVRCDIETFSIDRV